MQWASKSTDALSAAEPLPKHDVVQRRESNLLRSKEMGLKAMSIMLPPSDGRWVAVIFIDVLN